MHVVKPSTEILLYQSLAIHFYVFCIAHHSVHRRSVSLYHIIINCKQGVHVNVYLTVMYKSRHKHAELQKDIQSTCKYYKQNCMCTLCMFDSSHCPDGCTPYCCANFCTRGLFPMLFTAWTTVFQVRGRSPVPFSWASHFSTSCNIRSFSFDLSFAIPSKMADSTRKCVPKSLH